MSNVYSAFHFQHVKRVAEDSAVATKVDTSTTVSSFLELVDNVVAVPQPSAGVVRATTVGGVSGAESHTHQPWSVVMVGGATKGVATTMGGTCSTTALEGRRDQQGLEDMMTKDHQLVGVY